MSQLMLNLQKMQNGKSHHGHERCIRVDAILMPHSRPYDGPTSVVYDLLVWSDRPNALGDVAVYSSSVPYDT